MPFPPQPPQKVTLPCSAVHRYYDMVRLLQHVRVRIVVYGLRGPALAVIPRRAGDLPVLVHVVLSACPGSSTTQDRTATRDNAAAVLPSHYTPCSRHPDQPTLRSSIAGPTGPSVYASTDASRRHLQDSRPEWSRCLLSCGGLAPPTTCRFIPALVGLWATLT